ncbi:T-SNARE domain-containing protein [Cryptosporidium ubiquitum]|uniref:t-SNARE domain-containing protein n=1 Tax=Cryptosporidium ubiquitum TaxID=857276 RepID=A0A1J4MLP5_9CRYT|nr:T-SNARE domain-containing protein [Cryptosporidium ubiquitum]OII73940.1 T-SNARE domain-containing protein [Cryptosporidium ubiquitum]
MVLEIRIHDDDEENEEEEFNYFVSGSQGEWPESYERRIARLFEQLEEKLTHLEERISENQGTSKVSQEVCKRVNQIFNRIEQINQNINDTLRNWRIELAGNPLEYREQKEVLENYLAQQRTALDRIAFLNRKVEDLQSRKVETESMGFGKFNSYTNSQPHHLEAFTGYEVHNNHNQSYRLPHQDSSYELQIEDDNFRQQQHQTHYMSTMQNNQQTFDMVDRQIAQETAIGLGHIQSQMYEANQIFKNLASMVNEQGETIQNLETTIDNTVYTAKQAVGELRKAYNSSTYKFSLLANYGLPGFLLLILALILTLYFLHII